MTFVLVFVSRDFKLGWVPAVSLSRKKVFQISMKFGTQIEVDDWYTIQGQGQGHGAPEVPKIALFYD